MRKRASRSDVSTVAPAQILRWGGASRWKASDLEALTDWLDWAFDQLLDAGYEQSSAYTMVKPGTKFSYRDNLWHGSDLLATGIASFGHASGVHYQNLPEWEQYLGNWLA